MHWGFGWHAAGMWFFWIALLVILGVAVYLIARAGRNHESRPEAPREILQKRLARGEIDREEYERTLEQLNRA